MIHAIYYWLSPVKQRRACSFPGLIYAALVAAVVSMLVIATIGQTHGQSADNDRERAALVHVGEGGSGVCVSPEGHIFTAAHCVADLKYQQAPFGKRMPPVVVPRPIVKVRFQNQEWRTAEVLAIWWIDKGTDLALLRVPARGGLPCLPFAKASPRVGEQVTSIGFPAGHFARMEADVIRVGTTTIDGIPTEVIETSHRVNPGNSGGPLLNSRGEVCGIASLASTDLTDRNGQVKRSEQMSMFSRVESFNPMLAVAGHQPGQWRPRSIGNRETVDLWTSAKCEPCLQLDNDISAGRITIEGKSIALLLNIVKHEYYAEREAADLAGVSTLPTLVHRASGAQVVGYPNSDPQLYAQRVAQILNARSDAAPMGSSTEDYETQPPIDAAPSRSPPTPATEATADKAEPAAEPVEPDFDGVRVLLIVKKQELSFLQGSIASVVEKFAETRVKKMINTALGSKAEVDLIFERTTPARYTELLETAGITELKRNAAVVVLIPKKFTGVVGTIAEVIEAKLKTLADGDWKFTKIVTVAERVDPDGYTAMVDAVELSEPTESMASQTWLSYLVTALTSAFAGTRDAILGHKAKKAA